MDVGAISSSRELTPEVAQYAASSAQQLKSLVSRVAEIATPESGWTKLLKVIAGVAGAEWLEGDLQVDFTGDDKGTTLAFYAALGMGIRERLFAPYYLGVPIDEFQRAVVLAPDSIVPLKAHQGLNRMTLAAGTHVVRRSVPEFELEEKAKGDGERITAPPPEESEVHTRSTVPPPSE